MSRVFRSVLLQSGSAALLVALALVFKQSPLGIQSLIGVLLGAIAALLWYGRVLVGLLGATFAVGWLVWFAPVNHAWLLMLPDLASHSGTEMAVAQPWLALSGILLVVGAISWMAQSRSRSRIPSNDAALQQIASEIQSVIWLGLPNRQQILYVNPAYETLWGLSCQELYENPAAFLKGIHPDDRDRVIAAFERQITGTYDEQYRVVRSDGSCRWVRSRVFPIRDAEGEVYRIAGIVDDITERKQAEVELYHRQQEFKALVENGPDIIARFDRDQRHLYVNPAIEALTGISPVAFIGKTPQEMGLLDEQAAIWQAGICQVFATGQAQVITFDWQDRDGSDRTYQTRLVPEYDPKQQVATVLAITRDITAVRQAQTALQDEENRFRRLIESNVVGVMSWAADGRILDANDAFLRMVSYTRADLQSGRLNWRNLTPPDQLERSDQSLTQMRQQGYADALEKEYIRQDGSRVPVLLGGVMLERNPDRGVSFVLDLTVLKRTEAALYRSESRFQSLAQNIPGVIYQYRQYADASADRFTYISPGCYDLYGLEPQAVLQNASLMWEAVHPEDLPNLRRSFSIQAATGEQWRQEWRVLMPFGQIKWAQGVAKAAPQPDGSILWDGVLLDITERKQAEIDRDQLLEREQEARQRAEAASRAKDEFLAIVSHELRSPLNAILGWSRLLRTRQLDAATAKRALEVIERNAQAQTQLIEDLLDISRIIRGNVRLFARPVKFATVIEAAVDTIRPAADAKAIQIQTQLGAVEGNVLGDPDRLQQIVWNLLSNAVKFTPEGGQVTVQLTETEAAAELMVRDTGKGIEAEFLPHVFERFRQAESSSTRSFGGLGLGLAIVRSLVELHGGTIAVESPGLEQGATFWVQIPLEREFNDISAPKSVNQTLFGQVTGRALAGIRILVVDDEPDTREFLKTALEVHGATVMLAESAAAAFECIVTSLPDLLVSDIGMPQEDGYSLIRRIRALADDRGGRVPAAAITAYAREEDRVQALEAGFQLHVPKPIDPMQLIAVVTQLVEQTAS
jgi:PAS domain S-box-containing protein